MEEKIRESIKKALQESAFESVDFSVEHPSDPSHGDYATNVALVLSSKGEGNPIDIAEKVLSKLESIPSVQSFEIQKPGFINFTLERQFFAKEVALILAEEDNYGKNGDFSGEKVVVEYTQPNILKPFHIGHLMSNAIGESLTRLFEASGAEVFRANYQGDVGLHVAKALWGMKQLGNEMPSEDDSLPEKTEFLGNAYVHGSGMYEKKQEVKEEIDELNVRINKGGDEELRNLYETGRRWSLEHLEDIYKLLGTKFDRLYFESEVADLGVKMVKENTPKVFSESDGAIVYKGEEEGLHTRVFITSRGLPTYEAKELALPSLKYEDFKYDQSIVVTAEEQKEYFKVVLSALEKIEPELANKTKHITHGMMQLQSGKMSSRKGNVVTGESLLRETIERVKEKIKDREGLDESKRDEVSENVSVAAVKYSILKQESGKNIIYDEKKALSFEGDSGPYLQYTVARCNSVLEKGRSDGILPDTSSYPETDFEVERILYKYPEVVRRATRELAPHYVTNFLTELAGSFNSFYGKEKIVDKKDPNSPYRTALTRAVGQVLESGLNLLGIKSPKEM